jgi:antitoxin component YwqK of YwqJK toxin-antitoxin module
MAYIFAMENPFQAGLKSEQKNGRLAARFNFLNGVKHGEQIIYCFDGRTKYAIITYRLGHKKKILYKHPVQKQTKR